MRLVVVGCAGSYPSAESAASAYLVQADTFDEEAGAVRTWTVLMDLGNGALGALQRHAGLYDIDAICLSHLHADHCVDLYSYSIARAFSPAGPQPAIDRAGGLQ